ncbi:hypothetical protein L596_014302 [Steinernema carpocapsae]|uniref:Uncharacterized protein n=1 Tax=Steinernema carpocapsae TaxID=34508 RepID=A0A4U5NCC5_STECR|nr:hypothetical protein L596_014302 [Steinernema carpocapsae]
MDGFQPLLILLKVVYFQYGFNWKMTKSLYPFQQRTNANLNQIIHRSRKQPMPNKPVNNNKNRNPQSPSRLTPYHREHSRILSKISSQINFPPREARSRRRSPSVAPSFASSSVLPLRSKVSRANKPPRAPNRTTRAAIPSNSAEKSREKSEIRPEEELNAEAGSRLELRRRSSDQSPAVSRPFSADQSKGQLTAAALRLLALRYDVITPPPVDGSPADDNRC